MKGSDRTIVIGVGILVLVAAFYLAILGPKRHQAADLKSQADELQTQVTEDEQAAAIGEQAQADFAHNYRRLVALGKAVPADADTPSLLTQLQQLSDQSKVDFRSITLASSQSPVTATPSASSADPTLASESAAALPPIGATVGSAGLPVMPYSLEFQGGFFDVANFFGSLDSLVYSDKSKKLRVAGRLLTIDGFSLTAAPDGYPDLTASVAVTSYLAPKDQGVAAGATPAGPVTSTTEPATDTGTTTTPATTAVVGAN